MRARALEVHASAGSATATAGLPLPPCYEDGDLLASLMALRSPNLKDEDARIFAWGQLGLQLHTASLVQLRQRFAELGPRQRQVGLDDELKPWFAEQRLALGRRVLQSGHV